LIEEQIEYVKDKQETEYKGLISVFNEELARHEVSDDFETKLNDQLLLESLQRSRHTLFPAFKNVVWSLLRHIIKPEYRLEIDLSDKEYMNYGFATPLFQNGPLCFVLDRAIAHETGDTDRQHELRMLRHMARRTEGDFRVSTLMRIKILDMTQPPGSMLVTDIDGVFLRVSEKELKLELCEAKNKKKQIESTAIKELRTKLVPVLRTNIQYKTVRVKSFGAKLTVTFKH
jgi:hypothetical protein